jgi:uncharacterized membrane protein YqiK
MGSFTVQKHRGLPTTGCPTMVMAFLTTAFLVLVALLASLILILGLVFMLSRFFYKKTKQGRVLVRTGGLFAKQPTVSFTGMLYFPMVHTVETMDIALKRVEIERTGKNGLICKDNMRADIKVAFFVQVNKTETDVMRVAQSVGCERASDPEMLTQLFDAKFSEALKTVGKHFEFVELYNSRDRFKEEILKIIGRDLNGYVLDDAAINYLEQTPRDILDPDNILDAEGIKKITDLTSKQVVLANYIERDKEKTITKQNVEAQETILELNKQLAEKQQIQKREIATITAREEAETQKIQAEQKLKYERARIATEEEVEVATQNKDRQIIVATKSKEQTDAVETERVERDRQLEINERERIVTIAQIEKEKAVEEEKKVIQTVIRERVIVEKAVVQEEEAIKDTKAKALADRERLVATTKADEKAQELLITEVKKAESEKLAANMDAERILITANAEFEASTKQAQAMKTIADAKAADEAVSGLAEANVLEAKARAHQKQGEAEAIVVQRMAEAKLQDGTVDAEVLQKKAEAEAVGMQKKYKAEAEGIEQKALSMLKLDGVGREHEEFKIKLNKEKDIELAEIAIRTDIAKAQADILGEALKSAHIDIVGGEMEFFDRISQAITRGKYVDRMVGNSETLQRVEKAFLGTDGEDGLGRVRDLIERLGFTSEDLKNLSISALMVKMMGMTEASELKGALDNVLTMVKEKGLGEKPASALLKK